MKYRKKIPYIKRTDLPMQSPLIPTLVWWMFLDYVQAHGIVFGIVGTLLSVSWIIYIYKLFTIELKSVLFKE